MLVGYDSDDDDEPATQVATSKVAKGAEASKRNPAVRVQAETQSAVAEARPREARHVEKHGPTCDCDDCQNLLARFGASKVQVKGIRFKCKLCDTLTPSKKDSQFHFQVSHVAELQEFKRAKAPQIFAAATLAAAAKRKISFAREDVLGKRIKDEAASFGGFAKKEKPEPPPCETEEYQALMQEPVFTAAPWMSGNRPSNAEATPEDLALDAKIQEAQYRRFTKRNVLPINPQTCRCKLCYKTLGSVKEAEQHVLDAHMEDYKKEALLWERYLFTACKRQPPFGWVCKVCNIFFPTDGAVWRHIGKEVFMRQEERHWNEWSSREDRWGHEEDGECCGDGMGSSGLSFDSILKIQEEMKRQEMRELAASMEQGKPGRKGNEESDDEASGESADPPEVASEPQMIQEF